MEKEKLKSFLEILFILVLFLGLSFLVQQNLQFFEKFIVYGFYGILIYFFIVILAIVLAPISSIPLIPLMTGIFGWVLTGIISVLAWTAGSVIVFFICRKYSVPLVSKLISMKQIRKIENKIPKEDIFWTILLLRIVVPVDILSYALGLFSKVSFKKYFWATFFGIIPVTFILAYAGSVSFKIQMAIFGLVVLVAFIVLMIRELLNERKLKIKNGKSKNFCGR